MLHSAAHRDVRLHSVLMATDFSAGCRNPLHHAVAIARHYGAKFYLAHVRSSLGLTMAGPGAVVADEEAIWRDVRQLEDDLIRTGALAGVQHEICIRHGDVWPELEQMIHEKHVDLVVTGTHGRHSIGRLFLGSIAEQIFRQANCLVLTVPPCSYVETRLGPPEGNRRYLFATDFSDVSRTALSYAISLANQFAARLVLFHAVWIPASEGSRAFTGHELVEAEEEARAASLGQLQALVQGADLLLQPELVVKVDSADSLSAAILNAADNSEVDLIVLGLHRSRHATGTSHLPWTTAYEIVCGAKCPVLTVRG